MERRGYIRYAIGVLLVIGAIIIMIVLFNVIRSSFQQTGSNADTKSASGNPPESEPLEKAREAGKPVQFVQRGVVNGQDIHRSLRITVSPTARTIDILEGYNGTVIKSQTFSNTSAAYDAFVAALDGAGFTKSTDAAGRGTEGEVCPLGYLYTYEIDPNASQDFYRTWATSCSASQGTFTGSRPQVKTLFQRQIPDYAKFMNGVNFG